MSKLVPCALALAGAVVIGCSAPEPQSSTPQPTRADQGAPGAGDPYYPDDGNGGYDAKHYDVAITWDPDREHLKGKSTLTATATQPLARFNLDLRKLDVSSVRVDGRAAEFRREGEFELVITPERKIAEGAEFSTTVTYAGEPASESSGDTGHLGWHVTDSGAAYAVGEPHSAAYWYPVNETPKDKATFALSATVPKGWTAVSNGQDDKPRNRGGWTTYKWSDETPIASYLTTVAIDKFTLRRGKVSGDVPVIDAFAPGAEDKRDVAEKLGGIMRFLEQRFGEYPQTAAGGIYLSESLSFALETQTRPTYASWADEKTVVHEYAHQWFGNSVSLRNWSDMCLNECLASYTEWLWDEHTDDVDLDNRYREHVDANDEGDELWSPKLHEMGAGHELDGVYDKGKLAMHALRAKIGDRAFDQVLKGWAAKHKNGNASWPQFEEFVSEHTDEDMDDFFDAWFRGDERPPDEHLYPGRLRR